MKLTQLLISIFQKHKIRFKLSIVFFICCLFIHYFFYFLQFSNKHNLEIQIATIFQDEMSNIEPLRISNFLSDLDKLGVIKCTKLINESKQIVFFDLSYTDISNNNCSQSYVLLNGVSNKQFIDSVNGETWKIEYIINTPHLLIIFLSISLILFTLIFLLIVKLIALKEKRRKELDEIKFKSLNQFKSLAAQVAHDIRSPLAALDMALKETSGLPEQERIIVRTASNRIHEIANQLLQTAKRKSNNVNDKNNINNKNHDNDNVNIDDTREETPQKILLSSIIESIVAEKRVQFRNKQGLSIQSKLDENSYGIFASIVPREFKRIISNLINNSVEAFQNDCGNIEVSLQRLPESNNKMVTVMVKDNGKGIPSHIIAKLGTEGFSFGKNLSDESRESDNAKNSSSSNHSGSGLGLFHTKKMVEAWNGKFEVESIEGSGTIIKLFLPEETIPKSFVPQIAVRNRIVIVDDDQSIHQIWNGRFQSKKTSKHNVEIIHFSTLSDFEKWYTQNKCTNNNNINSDNSNINSDNNIKQRNETDLFFIDFEFINENMTGLDLIEKLNIERSATLVTSRYEEKNIQTRCDTLGIGLIPKDLVIYVPIVFENVNNIETILIDDDMLIRLIWTTKAKEKGITFKAYTDPSEINFSELDKNTILYIDSSLKNNQKGEELAEKLFANGFKNIYLATGYEKENFSHLTFFKGIIGKNPPW